MATVLVPQAVAYAFLGGLPPIYGLYAALSALVLYPIFASSRYLAVGPVALISIILMSGLSGLAEPFTEPYLHLVFLTALLSGIMQLLLAALRLGTLSKYLSTPVLKGFIAGAAIVISISQVRVLLSITCDRSTSPVVTLWNTILQIPEANIWSVLIGLVGIGLIFLFKKIHRFIPSHLLVVLLGIAVTYAARLDLEGVEILGNLPQGLPTWSVTHLQWSSAMSVLPTAIIVSLICFISSFSIAKAFEDKQAQKIDANRELISLGLIKVVGSFFLALPSSGSFSRSAVMADAGSKTKVTYYITATVILVVLLYCGSYFYYLPLPALAAIIIASVMGLISLPLVRQLYKEDRSDFWLYVLTAISTITLGVVLGIAIGVVASLVYVLVRKSTPHYAVLGQLPGTSTYRNVERFVEAELPSGCLVIRYDQDLFFGNADHFYNSLLAEMQQVDQLSRVILHFGSVHHVDSTALGRIRDILEWARAHKVSVAFAHVSGPIRDMFGKVGLLQELGASAFYLTVNDAVLDDTKTEYSMQHFKPSSN